MFAPSTVVSSVVIATGLVLSTASLVGYALYGMQAVRPGTRRADSSRSGNTNSGELVLDSGNYDRPAASAHWFTRKASVIGPIVAIIGFVLRQLGL